MNLPKRSQEFCGHSLRERDAFWEEQAQSIYWHRAFNAVCDFSRPPFVKWFSGGTTNLCYNAVDRHLETLGDHPALCYYSTEVDIAITYSFRDLYAEVNQCAAALHSLGVQRGDRVIIYLPMIPEAVFSMLACVRLGAIHSVVFAGFAPASLATRIEDARPKVLIAADAGLRGGKLIPLKRLVDEAISQSSFAPQYVVVRNRKLDPECPMTAGRDLDYEELREKYLGARVEPVWLESSEISYLLYTSGTTARPKGIPRDTGGHAVAMATSMRYIFAGKQGEMMFTAADVGWAVGHSYGVYGPLIHGMTTLLYEGLPVYPDGGIWWRLVEKYRATVMFTSPTAIRILKRQDPALLTKYDTSSLKRLFLAGEPLDESTWKWIQEALKIPVLDNYWQTETGWPVLALMPGIEPPATRPGSPGIAMPGYDARIVNPETGEPLEHDEKGFLALGLPLPPGCMPTVWNSDEMFAQHYCGRFPGKLLYSTFDYAVQDKDGYIFLLGRSDDVINVAGHRLGTREIEETLSAHPAVAEAATVGAADDLKGQAIHCFVVVKKAADYTSEASELQLKKQLESMVVQRLGSFSRPSAIYIVKMLPKTRSGKILRRAILAAAEGRETGDLSTLEEPASLETIRELLESAARSRQMAGH